MKSVPKQEAVVVEPQPDTPSEQRRAVMEYSRLLQSIVPEADRYVEVPDDLDGQADFVVYVERRHVDDVRHRLLDLSYALSVRYGVTLSSVVLPRVEAEFENSRNGTREHAAAYASAAGG